MTYRDKLIRVAGFMEGEGSFSVVSLPRGRRSQMVTACQKTIEPLNWVIELFGGKTYQDKRGMYRCARSCARARGIMMMLYPFMSPRRQAKIKECLAAPIKWTCRPV